MAFAGWFGPRGLATIVFMLTIIEESNLAGTDRIVQVATITVLFSVVAHGASAPWLTDRYVRRLSNRSESSEPESDDDAVPVTRPSRSPWVQSPQEQN
jgi:NhaP-type Na+/H+ or K+/H+ antiporter